VWHSDITSTQLRARRGPLASIPRGIVRTMHTLVFWNGGLIVNSNRIAIVAVLCALVAVVACRREEYVPMKLGGPAAEQPAR